MGGLAVARALSGHFREVVLIERDALSLDGPAHRPGVGQSWHIHNLTIGGQRELESLFPGFVETALALGAARVDGSADISTYGKYGWNERAESEFICLSATRALLEFAERKRFFALVKNARLLSETRVTDLLVGTDAGKARITGVATSHPDETEIHADLVVDCSGRKMNWKSWFRRHSLSLPKETLVDSRCAYSSRFYRPCDPAEFSWKALVVEPAYPERPYWGVILPLENGDWVVTLGGFNGTYPPADEQGFMDFARALPAPQYAQALERADPLTKVRAFRKLEMRWNHFESYDGVSRFLAVGDSAWAYNPLYGQGMSVAATCARILRDLLDRNDDLDTLARRYYPQALKFAQPLWWSTAQLDMRWPGTVGRRRWYGKLLMPLGELVLRVAAHDRKVFSAMMRVVHLLMTPMAAMLRPSILARLLGFALKEWVVGRPQLRAQMHPAPPRRAARPGSAGDALCCACSDRPCRCPAELDPAQ
jgi:flavin-dependent dehydrogenase